MLRKFKYIHLVILTLTVLLLTNVSIKENKPIKYIQPAKKIFDSLSSFYLGASDTTLANNTVESAMEAKMNLNK